MNDGMRSTDIAVCLSCGLEVDAACHTDYPGDPDRPCQCQADSHWIDCPYYAYKAAKS